MSLSSHPRVRFCCLLLVGSATPLHASAQDVLWLGEASPISAALGFELAPRGLSMGVDAPPSGEDPAERAARARIVGEVLGARMAVWVQASPPAVLTVRIEDGSVREAPLPASLEPVRLVAMVAASLIDEALLDDAGSAEPVIEEPRGAGGGAALDSPHSAIAASIAASRADEPANPEDPPAPTFAPYVAMTIYVAGIRSDVQPVGGLHSLEVGLAIQRTFRIAAQAFYPMIVPGSGAGAGGAGLTVSVRGAAGDVELRGGLGLSLVMRGVPNSGARVVSPSQPATLLQMGGVLDVHGRIGGRVSRTCALLGGVGLHGALLDGVAPHGLVSASFMMEWF